MRFQRALGRFFLLAGLVLPALAFFPMLMHGFVVPKSAVWEPLMVLAAALAWSLPRPRAGEQGTSPWWFLWGSVGLVLVWFGLASSDHSIFTGPNLGEFPLGFRLKEWIYRHLSLGLNLGDPRAGDWMFRGVAFLAALTLAERAWRSAAVAVSVLKPLPRMALLLAATWCLSAAFSSRPDCASPVLLDWGAYLLVFVAVWILATGPKSRGKVLAALFLAAALNAVYGLVQAAGYDPIHWAERFGGRSSGFFGNPDFLGGQMALMLPLCLALALRPTLRPVTRALMWTLLGLLGSALFASQTRGAILGAVVGSGLTLFCIDKADPSVLPRNRGALYAGALFLILGLGALWAFAPRGLGPRLNQAFEKNSEVEKRVFLMEKTADLAWEHPLLGVGPGAFRIWFPSVETVGSVPKDYASLPYVITEHGHNDFLQMAADAGWPAALLWAALCVLVFVRLYCGITTVPAREGIFLAGCLGGLAALRFHGLANFPFQVIPTESAAWAIAALGLRTALPEVPSLQEPVFDRGRFWRWTIAGVLVAAALLAARERQFFEDGLWWRGSGELDIRNPVAAAPILLKALDMDRREDRLWSLHGQAQLEQENIWQSIGSLREEHRLNPYDAQAALRLGQALIENRLYDEACSVLSSTVDYAPNFPDLWEPLAAALFQDKNYAAAVQAYDWMLYYHVDEENAYTNKAAALGNLGLLVQARATLLEAQQRFPRSGKVQINLAITLYKMGLRKDAYQAWKRASVLWPSDPQVDALKRTMRP